MSHQKIIFAILITCITIMSALAWVGKNQSSYTYQKDWWSISFVDPEDHSNTFKIENFGPDKNFTYTIFSESQEINSDTLDIKKGASKIIDAPSVAPPVRIRVSTGDEKQTKEIYK